MSSVLEQHTHKIVKVAQILTVCNAFGLDDEQTLEGMDNFLKDFPMLRRMLDSVKVPHYYLVNLLVLLDENQNQIMGRLSDLRLNYGIMYILIRE